MEDFSMEVVETITEYYAKDGLEGKELIKDILFYLYHTTTSDKLQQKILEWFNTENYCIKCGTKLQTYDWYETHTELEGEPKEHFTFYLCPICDDGEARRYGYTVAQ